MPPGGLADKRIPAAFEQILMGTEVNVIIGKAVVLTVIRPLTVQFKEVVPTTE